MKLKKKQNIDNNYQNDKKGNNFKNDNNGVAKEEIIKELKNNNINKNNIIDNFQKSIELDEEIIKIIYDKMKLINNLKNIKEEEDEHSQEECLNINNLIRMQNRDNNSNEVEDIPYKFKRTYFKN